MVKHCVRFELNVSPLDMFGSELSNVRHQQKRQLVGHPFRRHNSFRLLASL